MTGAGVTDPLLDVLVPSFERPAALAVTLAGLAAQSLDRFRVVVSDQSRASAAIESGEVRAVARVLEARGCPVELLAHLPRRGLAEQRAFLLSRSRAPYALFLDDDLLLEPDVLARMLAAIRAERCGFVGCAPVGLSYLDDERPHEQVLDVWRGPVMPELVTPQTAEWSRHVLHNAANVRHVEQRPELASHTRVAEGTAYIPYRVAWVGGCVLYDAAKLREAGGFEFWRELPAEHAGEDVLAQLRVMARFGGCGVLPSGVVHLELPTTVHDRRADAPKMLPVTFARPSQG